MDRCHRGKLSRAHYVDVLACGHSRRATDCSKSEENLTQRIPRTWRGSSGPAASKILLTNVKIAQSGAAIQRPMCCKVEMTTGRSISGPPKMINPSENCLPGTKDGVFAGLC